MSEEEQEQHFGQLAAKAEERRAAKKPRSKVPARVVSRMLGWNYGPCGRLELKRFRGIIDGQSQLAALGLADPNFNQVKAEEEYVAALIHSWAAERIARPCMAA